MKNAYSKYIKLNLKLFKNVIWLLKCTGKWIFVESQTLWNPDTASIKEFVLIEK